MSKLSRRDFIKSSMVAGATFAMATPFSKVLGANNDIRVAVVGLGWKGADNTQPLGYNESLQLGGHCKDFNTLDGVRVVAVCDADKARLKSVIDAFKRQGQSVKGYQNVRKLLEDKSIDVITSATPNHWHSLITIWACQADKDVYIEKPVSHEIWEGRRMVEAARKYKKIVQTGTQNRSDVGLLEAIPYIQKGNLGKILWVRALCHRLRGSIGKVNGPQPIPETVDYNLWTGPAQMTPLMREKFHYDWHWVWNTGCGDVGNQGVHEIDVCNWTLGLKKLPPRVITIGGRLGYDDDGQTANTQISFLDYKPAPIIIEVRNLPRQKGGRSMDYYPRTSTQTGNIIQCENGFFAGGRGGGWAYDNDGNRIKQFKGDGGGGHAQNFIDAVRSRKESDLRANILGGHISSALSHMVNISYRLGKKAPVSKIRNALGDNAQLMDSFERMIKHLDANEIDLEKTPLTLGPMLTMDPKKEMFTGEHSDWANMFVKRNYREPFVVPDKL